MAARPISKDANQGKGNMPQSLVTGGAGFIGSHLVRAHVARGDTIRVLDNLSSGSSENLDGMDVELMVGDIRSEEAVVQAMQGIDTVFHLAAFVSVPASMDDPNACYETNVMGSLNIMKASLKAGVRRVVLPPPRLSMANGSDNCP